MLGERPVAAAGLRHVVEHALGEQLMALDVQLAGARACGAEATRKNPAAPARLVGPEQQADAGTAVRKPRQRIAGIGEAGGIGAAQQRVERGCHQPALRLHAAQQQIAALAIGLLEGDVENDGDRDEGDDKKPELAG